MSPDVFSLFGYARKSHFVSERHARSRPAAVVADETVVHSPSVQTNFASPEHRNSSRSEKELISTPSDRQRCRPGNSRCQRNSLGFVLAHRCKFLDGLRITSLHIQNRPSVITRSEAWSDAVGSYAGTVGSYADSFFFLSFAGEAQSLVGKFQQFE